MLTKAQRDKWAEELESGRWKQCRAKIRNGNTYCCLGVLVRAVLEPGAKGHPLYPAVHQLDHATQSMFTGFNDKEKLSFPEIAEHVRALPVSDEGSDG